MNDRRIREIGSCKCEMGHQLISSSIDRRHLANRLLLWASQHLTDSVPLPLSISLQLHTLWIYFIGDEPTTRILKIGNRHFRPSTYRPSVSAQFNPRNINQHLCHCLPVGWCVACKQWRHKYRNRDRAEGGASLAERIGWPTRRAQTVQRRRIVGQTQLNNCRCRTCFLWESSRGFRKLIIKLHIIILKRTTSAFEESV